MFEALGVSRESRLRLESYVDVLLAWQQRINLIGPTTVANVWTRHILDGLQLLPLIPAGCRRIADLGSGAGIPGLVVSLAADIETHLYESNNKKCAFLREAIRRTGAKAHVHCLRIEDVSAGGMPGGIDCMTSRALAPLLKLLEYAEPFLMRGTTALFHKGRDVDLELTEATKYWKFEFIKHPSVCDSQGVILEMREVRRV